MAFYHTGSCSCPSGDCWCGIDYVYYDFIADEFVIFISGYTDYKATGDRYIWIGEL